MAENSKTELTLAYLAGMIDADGYITIQRSVRNNKAYYGPSIGIAGTKRAPHDLAATLWGGKVTEYKPKNPNHLPQFQWSRIGATAIKAINDIYPYLLVKKEQAELANSLWDHLISGKGDDPYPWMGPNFDPTQLSDSFRIEMIGLNNSRRRIRSKSTLDLINNDAFV